MLKQLTKTTLFFTLLINSLIFSQWQSEWNSTQLNYYVVSGWLTFDFSGNANSARFYRLDEFTFSITSGPYSVTPEYTYNFTQEEMDGGYLLYSLGTDLTGDGYTEFYVMSQYGSAEPYRYSFKIFDIVTGDILLEMDNESYSYDYPTIWDADGDNTLECTFVRYDYPNFNSYILQSYNTGVSLTGVNDQVIQTRFELSQNYPNPFNPSTTIGYTLDSQETVTIRIYDVKGEMIKSFRQGNQSPGTYQVTWDGKNQSGLKVSAGAYFYTIEAGFNRSSKKMLLIK